MVRRASRWIDLFQKFVKDARIASKEVVSTDERGAPLVLWESQKRFLENVAEGLDDGIRIFMCLKSRQLGCTTVSLLIDVFWLSMHAHLRGALVCDTEKNRDANRATIEMYVKSFPDGYFGNEFKIVKSNRMFIEFSNGARFDFIVAGTTKKRTTSWGEGQGYAFCHLTEVASYGDEEGLASLEESFAQQNPHRLFIYESTAKGFNLWRSKYLTAQADPRTYRAFFLGWWSGNMNVIYRSDPRYQEFGTYAPSGEERELCAAVAHQYGHRITDEQLAWIRWKENNAASGERDILDQNQPWTENQAFVMTGFSFFQTREISKNIKELLDNQRLEPSGKPYYEYMMYCYDLGNDIFTTRLNYLEPLEENLHRCELKVWEPPKDEGRYVIGADPAYGRNEHKDRHCANIYRCFADRIVQVAEYATSDVEAKHFAWVIAHLAGAYRDCIVNVEIDGPGRMIMLEWDHLRGMMQSDLYKDKVDSRDWQNFLGQARWYLYNRPDSLGRGYAANFQTTGRTKSEIMHQMRGAYVTKELDVRSLRLLEEMANIVQNGDEIGAPESSNENSKDDRVFATALAIRAWINWRRPELLAQGITYEKVLQEESGQVTPLTRNLNRNVERFFLTIEERMKMQEASPPQTWRAERGLE